MDTVLIVARLALAAVFAVAAIAKLADMPGSRRALEDFLVPPGLVPAASVALPAAEIASAILLIIGPTAQAGAALAIALLLMFVGGITAALRRGTAPDCHCFGQLHSKPAGKETIGRNSVLAAVGVYVLVAGPGLGVDSWVSGSSGAVVALAGTSLLVVVLAYGCGSLWRDNRNLRGIGSQLNLPAPLAVGDPSPEFKVTAGDGTEVRSVQLLSHVQRTIFVFTSATCGPCVGLLPELARWREMLVGRLGIHVLASGDVDENRRLATEHGMPVLFDRDGTVSKAFGILGTPSAVEMDATGRVGTPPVAGAPAIEGLIRAALKRPAQASELDIRHVDGRLENRTAGVAP
ncbi:MAG: TlpA disulfide reductase family protein [Solirubrobacteraceae bacterium]